MASSRRDWSLALQCLQVIDDLVHLLRFELELRHRCMTSSNSFPERLLKVFDRVPLVQIAERRRFRHWAVAVSPNRVTGRVIYLNDGAPFSLVRRLVGRCKRAKRRDGEQDQMAGNEALPTGDRSGAQHGFIADGRGSTGPRTPGPHNLEKTLLPPNAALCLEFTTELQTATRLRVGGK